MSNVNVEDKKWNSNHNEISPLGRGGNHNANVFFEKVVLNNAIRLEKAPIMPRTSIYMDWLLI